MPAVHGRLERDERAVRERLAARVEEGVAKRGRDREAGAIAHLEQALATGAAAAGEPVAAVLVRELDAVLLEPMDRLRRLTRQDLGKAAIRRLVRALPHVLGVLLRRVVVSERGLDPALCLGGVARLEGAFRHQGDAGAGPFGRHGRSEAGGPASDHEHVDCQALGHGRTLPNSRN